MKKTQWEEIRFRTGWFGLFIHDWKEWGLRTAWYNLRFMFASWLLRAKRRSVTPKRK